MLVRRDGADGRKRRDVIKRPDTKAKAARRRLFRSLVGTAGFEPATTTPPVWCATRLRYAPKVADYTQLRRGCEVP